MATSPTIPWYKSVTILGAGVAMLASTLKVFGIDIGEYQSTLVDGIINVTTLLGALVAIYGRIRGGIRPAITATSKSTSVIAALLLPVCLFSFSGCAELQTAKGQAIVASAEGIAKAVIPQVVAHYGGQTAGDLAAAGLSGLAVVLQGYVGSLPPSKEIVLASPGVAGVGQAVVKELVSDAIVKQSDVDKLHAAAQIVANSTQTVP